MGKWVKWDWKWIIFGAILGLLVLCLLVGMSLIDAGRYLAGGPVVEGERDWPFALCCLLYARPGLC